MDAQTQAEYDRLKAGPQSGLFTFLHHEGPIVEQSNNIMERIEYILRDKPESEHYTRLRHIYFVSAPAEEAYQEAKARVGKAYQEAKAPVWKAYQEAKAPAWKAYQEAKAPAEEAYQEAIAPAEKAYQEAIAPAEKAILAFIPNCAWNGKTILAELK